MQYEIKGELAQVALLTLEAGETCWGNRGTLMSLTPAIDWTLKVPGGLGGAVKRSFAGEGISLLFIEAQKDNQHVALTSNQPGKIMAWDLSGGSVLTTRGSFVAAFGKQVDITVVVARRAGAAFFGGAGLFLQKISGDGMALIHGSGDFVERNLQDGESILVSTGNLAAFAEGVDYDIQGVGGCRRMLFGGEGLFMTKLTGPGQVLLQTLKRTTASRSSSSSGAS